MLLRSSSFLTILCIAIFYLLYYFIHLPESAPNVAGKVPGKGTSSATCGNPLDVKNETLGFSQVFVVALPERSDKRDAISMSASLTGVKFDWVDGVNGDLIPEKAIPMGWEKVETTHTLGCWRAHMNAVQRMVKEQIQTALILEDDADWDVNLKSQLVEFAKGSCFLQGGTKESKVQKGALESTGSSPYGDDWDLLWLGHCGTRNREDMDQRYYVIHDDPTAIPQKLWGYPRRQPNLTPPALQGNHTRVIFEPVRGLCMFGYALSLRGAQRLMYHQSIAGRAAVSDRALQRVCNERFMGFKCIAPYPTLIGTHKAAGSTAKDSDREDTANAKGGFREVGETGGIVYSTRLNMEALVAGSSKLKSQWPDQTMLAEVDRGMEIPQGSGAWVTKDMYKPFDRPT